MSWMLKAIKCYWRHLLAVLTPIIFLLVPTILGNFPETRCAYIILIMVTYWTTEIVPLTVTALVPVFGFPILGILSTRDVCLSYMEESIMMMVGSVMLAVALRESGLDKRIAAFLLMKIGKRPRVLLGSFMGATMFLSMWMNNVTATAIVIPALESVLDEMDDKWKPPKNMIIPKITITDMEENKETSWGEVNEGFDGEDELGVGAFEPPERRDVIDRRESEKKKKAKGATKKENLRKCFYLSVAYSANIGGLGLLPGSPSNLVLHQILTKEFEQPTELTFNTWMAFNIPIILISTAAGWIWLQYFYIGIQKEDLEKSTKPEERKGSNKKILESKYKSLGSLSFHEGVVTCVLSLLLLCWIFRIPGNFPGWSDLFHKLYGGKIDVSATSALMLALFILFLVPSNLPDILNPVSSSDLPTFTRCISWKGIESEMPWEAILLIGAGYSIAKASEASGLISWHGRILLSLRKVPIPFLSFFLSVLAAIVTNIIPNTATATVFLRIFKNISLSLCVNPLYLTLPVAVCCSFAFMLPMATPSNVLVYYACRHIQISDMLKAGIGMNIICIVVTSILTNTLGVSIFSLNDLPDWVNSTTSGQVLNC